MDNLLKTTKRLLLEVELKPIQGERFQPTGFPDLGAAEIPLNDKTTSLLVESAQSMANRLEEICLNESKEDFVEELKGLTMIKVNDKDGVQITNSVRESHRSGSHYIVKGDSTKIVEKFDQLKKSNIGKNDITWNTDVVKTAPIMFELDVNSLLHGVWIADKIAEGRIKIPRALSSFIEAKNVNTATSGGTKIDHVQPGTSEDMGGAKEGQGNVPFSRIEYTAESITAFFNLDLQQIRSYGLDESKTELLINLALWKIQKFLETGLRLRTACDLQMVDKPKVTFPEGFTLPDVTDLNTEIKDLISKSKIDSVESIVIEYKKKGS